MLSRGLGHEAYMWISIAGTIAVVIGTAMIVIRRVHDLGRNGWWALLLLVPLANLYIYFAPGTAGVNSYGPPPGPNTPLLRMLAALFFLPLLVGILFVVPLPFGKWVYATYCNDPTHTNWHSEFTNFAACSESSSEHFEKFRGVLTSTGQPHSAGCQAIDAPFPWNFTLSKDENAL